MPDAQHFDAPIRFFNRSTGEIETEDIYGEGFMRWAYGNPLGRLTVKVAVKRLWFSRWYGWRMDRPKSQSKVEPFIETFGVDVNELADPVDSYRTFNQFFYRKLKPEARPIAAGENVAVFPADGRHLAIANVSAADTFYLKGQAFDLTSFIGDQKLAREFEGGSLLISRLCPVDYHRFHFPVGGQASASQLLPGTLRSVSPLALRRQLSILWENRRERTVVDSESFGKVLVFEVGATCVGGIHQTYAQGAVEKGSEKGYFSFGGSCVTTVFQKDAIQLDADLIQHSSAGIEVYAKMGQRCGVAGNADG
jgi:phosphatidylserine decarboxylase